jgi:hypothetical protein
MRLSGRFYSYWQLDFPADLFLLAGIFLPFLLLLAAGFSGGICTVVAFWDFPALIFPGMGM